MAKLKPFCEQPGTLLIATRKLLNKDARSIISIHKKSGLPFYWLIQFKANRSSSSSVDRVQYLFEFLSGKKLDL